MVQESQALNLAKAIKVNKLLLKMWHRENGYACVSNLLLTPEVNRPVY